MHDFKTLTKRFEQDKQGAISIIFALGIIVLFMMIGLGLDTGRAVQAAGQTTSALDAAALAAAKAMREEGLDDAGVSQVATNYFNANVIKASASTSATYTDFHVESDDEAGSVKLSVSAVVPTLFARVGGFNQFKFNRSSTAIYNLRDIELGMMLDVTGSMGGSKIEDLREAAKNLVDILITNNDSSQNVRIGLAPYSASVNAGALASRVTDPLNPSVDGCVIERTGYSAYDDTTPGNNTWVRSANPIAVPADIDPTEGNGTYRCPTAALMPLTDDHEALKDRIDSFSANGWTSGHIGLAWAWYLVSPEWNNVWPVESEAVAYKDGKTIKAVIMMTDGNFNTAYANGQSADQAEQLCDEMRANDKQVIIFSIAFQAPEAAKDLLKGCASEPSGIIGQTYFDSSDGEKLKQDFKSIAIQLNNLRVAQ